MEKISKKSMYNTVKLIGGMKVGDKFMIADTDGIIELEKKDYGSTASSSHKLIIIDEVSQD